MEAINVNHFYTVKNAHYFCPKYPPKAFFKVYFSKFSWGRSPNPPSRRGSPPPTPTPVSALRASECPYRPLAPCPFQILAEALGGVNSTIIQCVHEQSLTGICIFPVFYLLPMDNGSPMYKSLTKIKKNTQSLKPMKHWKEWLQQMQ